MRILVAPTFFSTSLVVFQFAWTNDRQKILIDFFKGNEFLYNPIHPDYKKRRLRDKKILELCNMIGCSSKHSEGEHLAYFCSSDNGCNFPEGISKLVYGARRFLSPVSGFEDARIRNFVYEREDPCLLFRFRSCAFRNSSCCKNNDFIANSFQLSFFNCKNALARQLSPYLVKV